MVAFSRVTVIGSSRRLDVSLPEGVPVAELLLDLVGMLDESSDGAPARWALVKVGGRPLDPEQSLAEQGVASGTMLFLRDLTEQPPPPAIDDFAQQVAITVDAEKGHWAASMFQVLLAGAGAACVWLSGTGLLLAADRGLRTVAGIAGAALASLAGLALVRLAARRDLAGVITLAALPLWAAAGAGLAAVATAGATGTLGASLAAISVGAAVALVIAGDPVLTLSGGVIAATLLPAIVLGGCELFGAGIVSGAAIVCPIGLAAIGLAAPVSARFTGVTSADSVSIERDVRRGRRLLAASLTGIAVMLAASSAVLAGAGGWFAWGLIAVTAIAAAAMARHHRFAWEVAPLVAAALAGAILLELSLLIHRGTAVVVAALIADGLVLGVAAGALRTWALSAQVSRRIRTLEWIAVAASVPLALGVLGVYDAAVRFARGFS